MFEQINQWHLNFLLVKVVDQQFLKNYFAAATRKIDLKAKTKCTTRFSTLKTIYLDSLREKIKFSRLLFSQSFWGLKFQNGFTHVQLRGRDTFLKIWPIIRICLFTWTCQHKFLPTPGKYAVLFRPSAKKVWYMIRKSKISEKIWMSFPGFDNKG